MALATSTGRHFDYNAAGQLACDHVLLEGLAARHGTPLFVYSARAIREAFHRIRNAFAAADPLIAYSVKANGNQAIIRLLAKEGAAFDIVSGGELERIRRAGIPGHRVIFAGVGKSEGELREALEYGVHELSVESVPEAERLAKVARELGVEAPVALRVNPNVDAKTHSYITTGKTENKFGIAWEDVLRLVDHLSDMPGLRIDGLHAHIGSQILDSDPHRQAVEVVDSFLQRLKERGLKLKTLNFGGGFGIRYKPEQQPLDLDQVAKHVVGLAKAHGLQLVLEPGRSIIGPAGVLVAQVEYVKRGREKTFLIVDAAMTELLRPALYEAYHEILPARRPAQGTPEAAVDVVGPVCESADFLAKGRTMPLPAPGDYLVALEAGAYCSSMGSNYNARRRPTEVLVEEDGAAHVIRERETFDDLFRQERVPAHLA